MYIPSTELLTLILDKKLTDVSIKTKNIVGMQSFEVLSYRPLYDNASFREINLYELAHKCKKWALSKEWHINSKLNENGASSYVCWNQDICNFTGEYFVANTEPEVIFKACQWILNDQVNNEDKNQK